MDEIIFEVVCEDVQSKDKNCDIMVNYNTITPFQYHSICVQKQHEVETISITRPLA